MKSLEMSVEIWDQIKIRFENQSFNSHMEYALYEVMGNLREEHFVIL